MKEAKVCNCPSCGGLLKFNIKVQKVRCNYCQKTFLTDDLSDDDINWIDKAENENEIIKPERLKEYVCSSCGAVIEAFSADTTAKCLYCGCDLVLSSNFTKDAQPDEIVPFTITREKAVSILNDYLESVHYSVPKELKNGVQKGFSGFYVPVWLYNCRVSGQMEFYGFKAYKTLDAIVKRGGHIDYVDFPVKANDKIEEWLINSVANYDYSKAVEYADELISGFYSSRYTISASDTLNEVRKNVIFNFERGLENDTYEFYTIKLKQKDVKVYNEKLKYVLVPMWICRLRDRNWTHIFAVNGQNGELIGDELKLYATKRIKIFNVAILIVPLILGIIYNSTNSILWEKAFIAAVILSILLFIIVLAVRNNRLKKANQKVIQIKDLSLREKYYKDVVFDKREKEALSEEVK